MEKKKSKKISFICEFENRRAESARPGGHPVLREEVCGKVQRAFDKMDVCETKFVEMVSKDTTEAESQSTDWSNDDVQY